MDVVAGHRPQLYYQDCSTIYYVFLFLCFFFFFFFLVPRLSSLIAMPCLARSIIILKAQSIEAESIVMENVEK